MGRCEVCGSDEILQTREEEVCSACGIVQRNSAVELDQGWGNDRIEVDTYAPAPRNLRGDDREFITNLVNVLNLPPNIVDRVVDMITRRAKLGSSRSRERAAILCACIFRTCQEEKCPRVAKEIAAASGLHWRHIIAEGKRLSKADTCRPTSVTIRARDIVARNMQRYCALEPTSLSDETCKNIVLNAKHMSAVLEGLVIMQGKSSSTIAAAACILAGSTLSGSDKITVEGIARSSGVAATTVAKALHSIRTDNLAKTKLGL